MRLSRAIFSANPVDENTAQELTTIFRTATIDRVSINPRLVNVASKKVTAASQVSPSAWPAALALLDYRSGVVARRRRHLMRNVRALRGFAASTANASRLPWPSA